MRRGAGSCGSADDAARLAAARRRPTGTKEGCAEGDCGACTVVLARLRGRARRLRAGQRLHPARRPGRRRRGRHGRGPRRRERRLHPVQQAMVEQHGSQCGFCTPGFVMCLFALYQDGAAAGGARRRCSTRSPAISAAAPATGPIVDAALQACARRRPATASPRDARRAGLARLADDGRRRLRRRQGALLRRARDRGGARRPLSAPSRTPSLVAGATDVGLWVTKALADPPQGHLPRPRRASSTQIERTGERAGASAPASACARAMPPARRHRSRPRRADAPLRLASRCAPPAPSAATSPTARRSATSPPRLIALGATLELRARRPSGARCRSRTSSSPTASRTASPASSSRARARAQARRERALPRLQDDQALRRGHLRRAGRVPLHASTDARIAAARIAFGGMAGTPHARARLRGGARRREPRRPAHLERRRSPRSARDFTPLDRPCAPPPTTGRRRAQPAAQGADRDRRRARRSTDARRRASREQAAMPR